MAKVKTEAPKTTPEGVPPAGGAPGGEEKPQPPFGTPVPTDAGGELPRVCRELERAAPGTTRVKVACRNYSPKPTRYLLVPAGEKAADAAAEFYLKDVGLDREVARARKLAGAKADDVEQPDLAVTVLPD